MHLHFCLYPNVKYCALQRNLKWELCDKVTHQGPRGEKGSWLGMYIDRGEGNPTAETSRRQTAKQATWSLQCQRNAGWARTEQTHAASIAAIPNGASLARQRSHSSDTHNMRTWVQCSCGTKQNVNAVLVQRGGGKQDPWWIINHWAGPDGGMEGWRDERPATAEHSQLRAGAVPA